MTKQKQSGKGKARMANTGLKKRARQRPAEVESRVQELEKKLSELKGIQEKLALREEGLQTALHGSPVTIFGQDKELRINWVYNPVPPLKAEEILGKTDGEILPPESAAAMMKIKRRVLESGKGAIQEVSATIQGKVHFFEMRVEPVRNKESEVVGLNCLTVDITERRETERRVEESEKKYRELYEGSQDGFVRMDMEGNIQESNLAYREMLGYSQEELRSLTYMDLTPAKWHSMEAEIVKEQVLVKGYSDVYEKEYLKKNGTIFPISLRTYLTKDASGNPEGMWAFIRDITKRKEMEKDLRRARNELEMRVQKRTAELEEAYQNLEEQSKILESFFRYNITPFVLLDKDFNFIRVNEAYAKACRRDVSEFPGHNHFEYFPHEENEAIFGKVVKTKAPFQTFAKPFIFPDHPEWGTTYWDWALTPILDREGEVEYLVFSLKDVTERSRAEEKLRQNEELLRNVLDLLPVGVWIADKQGVITYGNPAGRRIWAGYRYVGIEHFGEYKGWWLDTGKQIQPEGWAVARAIRKGETSLNEEIEIECFDGPIKEFFTSSTIFSGQDTGKKRPHGS